MNLKKKVFTVRLNIMLVVFSFAGYAATAQWDIGLAAGGSLNSLQTNIANRPQQQLAPATGLAIQIPVSYYFALTKHKAGKFGLALETSIMFAEKGYALNRTDTLHSLDQKYLNRYVDLPAALLFSFNRMTYSFRLGGGMYVGYWVSGRVQGGMPDIFNTALPWPATYNYNEPYAFDSRRDNRWEYGWTVETKFAVTVQPSLSVFLTAQLFEAASDQQRDYMLQQVPRYNNTWAMMIGIQKELK